MRLCFAFALLVLAASSGLASADDKVCSRAPHDTKPRAYRLALGAKGSDREGVLVASGSSEFPAVSADGKYLVYLFDDYEDFTGAPIGTLVVWDRTGDRVATLSVGGISRKDHPDPARVLKEANAWLAKSKWIAIPVYGPCESDPSDEVSTVRLGGGLEITYRTSTNAFYRGKKLLAGAFQLPGSDTEGGCGFIHGISAAFGGGSLPFIIATPDANVGGDLCVALPTYRLAAAVRLK